MTLHAQGGSPQLDSLGAAVMGCVAGCLLAWALATLLSWKNLRGSFALPLAVAGYAALVQFGEAFYGWTLLIGGLAEAQLRRSWLREDQRAGGELGRRAQESLTMRAFLRNWWERRSLARSGVLISVTAAEHVRAVRDSLPASHEWDEREASLLGLAEAQARDIEALEAVIAERGVAAKDSWRLNAAVSEVRQARVALARILGQIDVPEVGRTSSSHARNAAKARWAS
jgi:hypothetical protein